MPDRYHINTVPTPGQFHRIGKYGGIDWREDCSRCSRCVKPRCCFDVYKHESAHNSDPTAPVQTLYECRACFSCVQSCTKGLLSLSVNPQFLEMGDEYWKPDIILSTWNQADTGKIPVSGAGYRGPFRGSGFDSMWTDMSEIVRPTRDGIHGREYISTLVDLGPKPMRLNFTPDGKLLADQANLLELPLPLLLDVPAWPLRSPKLAVARGMAARELQTLAVVHARDMEAMPADLLPWVAPLFDGRDGKDDGRFAKTAATTVKMVLLSDSPDFPERALAINSTNPQAICAVRMLLGPQTADRILELSQSGMKVFQLCADRHGREYREDGAEARHIRDALRQIHARLVNAGVRDELTLIVSGGIALAEHMAKAIICGADLVAADTVLLAALGCRVCRNAHPSDARGESGACRYDIDLSDSAYAAQRMINLAGAWHSQLIEVLGAMGIREVRRLRGETGRAIFAEEIEREAFGGLLRVPHERAIV